MITDDQKLLFDSCQIKTDCSLLYPKDLNQNSVVVDIGGFTGDWSSRIYNENQCQIYIFEPTLRHYRSLVNRFQNFPKVSVFNEGLSSRSYSFEIKKVEDTVSDYNIDEQVYKVTNIIEKFDLLEINAVDCLKISVLGEDFDIIQTLFISNRLKSINHIFIQPVELHPLSIEFLNKTRDLLSQSHFDVFSYDFVWDYWKLRS